VFFVLLGQLAAAATIDHFGLWGAVQSTVTPKRVLGIAMMGLGVYLARKPL
jgi:transporter family-2 protein